MKCEEITKDHVVKEIARVAQTLNDDQLYELIFLMELNGEENFNMDSISECFYACVGGALSTDYYEARKITLPWPENQDKNPWHGFTTETHLTLLERYYTMTGPEGFVILDDRQESHREILDVLKHIKKLRFEAKYGEGDALTVESVADSINSNQ